MIAELHKERKLSIQENLVITWPYTRLHPSAPQGNQRLISHFLAIDSSLGAQVESDIAHPCCGSCQNSVSADQYHLTLSRAQVSTYQGRVFFEVIR